MEEEVAITALIVKNSENFMVIGITGGIASGKSFVSSELERRGYFVLDTDKLYKELLLKGNACYNAIVKVFPYLNSDLSIDTKKLGSLVFNNKDELKKLNDLVHPIIYKECERIISLHKDETMFLVVPLMFESGFDKLCDKIICVYVSFDTQVMRLMARDNITRELAIKKINSQMDVKEKMDKSDILLESCLDFNDTIKNIDKCLKEI